MTQRQEKRASILTSLHKLNKQTNYINMKITEQQKQQINELTKNKFESLDLLYILETADQTNIEDLTQYIDEQTNGFFVEIIYYTVAMKILRENDPSLNDSLALAKDYGFELDNLNSEKLASLLASDMERNNYYEIQDELAQILFPEVVE